MKIHIDFSSTSTLKRCKHYGQH